MTLPSVGYRSYQKLTNVFVPCGRRLQPPPRRDLMRRLFGDNHQLIVILVPDGKNGFVPVRAPLEAFASMESMLEPG